MAEKPYFITQNDYEGGFRQFPGVIQAAGPRVQNGDWLALTLTTSDATGSVEIRGRVLTDNCEIVPFQQLMTFSGAVTQTAVVARLGGGWLQGFDVHVLSGTITDGEVVAAVHLGTGEGSTARYECCLASGEVTNIRSLGMGAFLIRGPEATLSTSVTMVTATAAPAAGADFSFTVTAAQTWEIFAVRGLLTTSATVSNRNFDIVFDDGTNIIWRQEAPVAQAASLAYTYSVGFGTGYYTPPSLNQYAFPAPRMILQAGGRVRAITNNLQAGDQWTVVVMQYRQYS